MNDEERKDYYERVRDTVAQIPKGRVTTFGAIASYLGVVSGARMVGYALQNSKEAIPAHRVLNRLGQLTGRGHFPDNTMRERLKQEGVTFVEEYTVDIDEHFWDPSVLSEKAEDKSEK